MSKHYGWGWRPGRGWGGLHDEPGLGFSGLGFVFGGPGRFFESGQARLAILSLLADGPKHGYELIKDLAARSGGAYRASAGTIYPTLQLLEDQDLVTAEQQDGKKVYRLTDAGRAELDREQDTVDKIWERASNWGDWSQWMRSDAADIVRPMAETLKATFKAARKAARDPKRARRVKEILEDTLKRLEDL